MIDALAAGTIEEEAAIAFAKGFLISSSKHGFAIILSRLLIDDGSGYRALSYFFFLLEERLATELKSDVVVTVSSECCLF